jgi:hypothetical protein
MPESGGVVFVAVVCKSEIEMFGEFLDTASFESNTVSVFGKRMQQ